MKPELQPGVPANSAESTPSVYELTPEQSLVVDGVAGVLYDIRRKNVVIEADLPRDHADYPGGQLNVHPYYGFDAGFGADHPAAGVWGLKVQDQLDARLHVNPTLMGRSLDDSVYRPEYTVIVRGEDGKFGLADEVAADKVVALLGLLSQFSPEKTESNEESIGKPRVPEQHGARRIFSALAHLVSGRLNALKP